MKQNCVRKTRYQTHSGKGHILCAFSALALLCIGAQAQTGSSSPSGQVPDAPRPLVHTDEEVTLASRPVAILKDQRTIWTSPARVRTHDLVYLVPLGVAAGVGFAEDKRTMNSVVSHDSHFNQANVNASNVIIGGFIAAPVALFGVGILHENAYAREAGILSGEAILDGLVVEQGLKLALWRERPAVDHANGKFFQGSVGVDSSFPSSHSVLAWSSAAVIAGEYPSRWTQIGVYSLATGVSLTRVMGQQHFPTDVLVGSAAGWLVGRYVYRSHHRHSLETR